MAKTIKPATDQRTLELVVRPQYPKRPQYFAMKFMRLMLQYFAGKHNPQLALILAHIVSIEDQRRYLGEPTFWVSQIVSMLGLRNKDHVSDLIKQTVETGWLHWHKPSNREIATAWVIVPMAYESELSNGLMCDESNLPGVQQGYHPEYHPANHPVNHPAKDPANHPVSSYPLPLPVPSPKPSTPTNAGVVGDEVEKLLKEAGVARYLETIEASRKLGNSDAWIVGKIQYFNANKGSDWGPGLLATHLKTRSFAGTPAKDGWPARTTSVVTRPLDAAAEAIRKTQQQDHDRKERQLEFNFGSLLDELTPAQHIELLGTRTDSGRLIDMYRHSDRAKRRGGIVRLALLEAFAAQYANN